MRHITRLSNYRTMAIGLLFFAAVGLSECWISDWRIQETIRLSDIGFRPQSIGLTDIRLRENHRLPTSAKYMRTMRFHNIAQTENLSGKKAISFPLAVHCIGAGIRYNKSISTSLAVCCIGAGIRNKTISILAAWDLVQDDQYPLAVYCIGDGIRCKVISIPWQFIVS